MKNFNKRFKRIIYLIAVSITLLSADASAQSNIPNEYPSMGRSVRALGMGNAFIAMKGNEYSPFYNAAGLNDIEEWRIKFLSMTFDMALDSLSMYTDAKDLIDALDASQTDAEKILALDTFVQSNIGEFKYLRYHMDVVNFVMKNFATGILFDERLTFSFRDQSNTNFEIKNFGDVTLYLSGAYGLWDKLLQFGVTLRPILRFGMDDRITYDVVISSSNSDLGDRFKSIYKDPKFGFAADIGFKTNLNFPFLKENETYKKFQKTLHPTAALTWQDIGNPFPSTKTISTGDVLAFPENQQTINLGFAIHPQFGNFATSFEIDLTALNVAMAFMKKFHVGGELRFPKILSLRAGFNQGYITGGISADFKYVILDFATYAEESGVFGSREGNRRIAATLNFGI